MTGRHRPGYNRRRKELRYLRAIQPGYTARRDVAEAKAHIEMLLSYGWLASQIERKAGVGKSVVSDILLGKQATLHVDTEAAILGVKLTAEDIALGPGLTVYGRALGAHRIVAGLAASGWTYQGITAHSAGWGEDCLRRYGQRPGVRKRSQISRERYLELRSLAARLEPMDPVADGGCELKFSRAARAKALNRGYAPLGCWDLETIHLPESLPEWTGECGTVQGYYLHLKYEIHTEVRVTPSGERRRKVLCQPCIDARLLTEGVSSSLNEDAVREDLRLGRTYREIAADHGVSVRTIQRVAHELKKTGWEPNKKGPGRLKRMQEEEAA